MFNKYSQNPVFGTKGVYKGRESAKRLFPPLVEVSESGGRLPTPPEQECLRHLQPPADRFRLQLEQLALRHVLSQGR